MKQKKKMLLVFVAMLIKVAVALWEDVSFNYVCDTSAGEIYIKQSPGKLKKLEACQRACENHAECQSFTYYQSRWCSLFKTPCDVTTWKGGARSMRFVNVASRTTQASTLLVLHALELEYLDGRECNENAGEKLLYKKTFGTYPLCVKSCQEDDMCLSITFFSDGTCKHFSTLCTNTKKSSTANSERLKLKIRTTTIATTSTFLPDL